MAYRAWTALGDLTTMMSLVRTAFFAGVALNFFWFLLAVLNPTPGHMDTQSFFKALFWTKGSTDREYFTDVGWRYRTRAIRTGYVMLVLFVLLVVFGQE